ncbi:MAG: hypothetical protein VW362_08015 [Candidatus Nanopelagicales bacterium]
MQPEPAAASHTAEVPGASVINAMASGVAEAQQSKQSRTARDVFRQIGQTIHQRMRRDDTPVDARQRPSTPAAVQSAAMRNDAQPSGENRGIVGRFLQGFGIGFKFAPRMAVRGLRRAMQSVAYRSLVHPTLARHIHGLWRIEQAARHADHGHRTATAARPMTAAAPRLQAVTATATPTPQQDTTSTDTAAPLSVASGYPITDALALPAAPAALANLQSSRPIAPRRSDMIMGNVSRSLRNAVRSQTSRPSVEAVNTSRPSVEKQEENRQEAPAKPTVMQRVASTAEGRVMLNMMRTVVTQGRRHMRQLSHSLDPRATGGAVHRATNAIRNELRPQATTRSAASVAGQPQSLLRTVASTSDGRRLLSVGRRAGVMLRRRARQALGRRVGGRLAGRTAGNLLARMGGGMVARVGAGSAGGAVAGGGVAAAAGIGAAGIVGVVAGVAAFGALITVALTPAMKKFAEHVNEGNRHLSRYNGSIAAAFARLDIGRFHRERMMGQETSVSSTRLSDAVNEMEEALHPLSQDMRTIGNSIAFVGAKIVTFVATVAEYAKEKIPFFETIMQKIEENTKKEK